MARSIVAGIQQVSASGLSLVWLAIALSSCSSSGATHGGSGGAQGGGGSGADSGTGGGQAPGSGGGPSAGSGGQGAGAGGSSSGGSGQTPGGRGGASSPTGGAPGQGGGGRGGTQGGTAGATLSTGGAGGSAPAGAFPSQACLDRANGLLAQMTQTDKFSQMLQMERAALTPALVTQYGIGSAFSQGGSGPATNSPTGWADMADGYRRAALARPLKIPFIYGADEVHGIGTVRGAVVFPHNVGLGATRDVPLVSQIAQITAAEALGCGVDFLFSPVVAVALNERWGRTYEAFGETTELASTMGVAMIKGLQFTPAGAATGILANAKHYLGDGGTTNGQNGGTVVGNEAALRAIHLEPYRAAVAAHVGSIMASYSSWQGTKMHVNRAMITTTLKNELGFGGFVISDFDACFQLGLANTAAGQQDGLGQCLNAGIDMFMLFRVSIPTVLGFMGALVPATVPQTRIDDAVRRIVAVKCEMGLFEGTGMVDRTLTTQVGSAPHRMVARQAVQKSLVVLKNDGNVLPLAKTGPVVVGGKSADSNENQCGGWTITWQGTPPANAANAVAGVTTIRQAMQTVLGPTGVAFSPAGATAPGATVGVAVIGETPYAEGTGDSANLAIAPADVAVVQAMKTAGLKTVVVLIAGRPLLLDSILPIADAIVMAWLPGSEGAGITDVLFGDVRPTGKLPHSWPRTMAQLPINFGDATYDPLYPFGFGLTYP